MKSKGWEKTLQQVRSICLALPEAAEVEAWRQKDPIERFGRQLQDENLVTSKMIAALRQAVETEVRGAVERTLEGLAMALF